MKKMHCIILALLFMSACAKHTSPAAISGEETDVYANTGKIKSSAAVVGSSMFSVNMANTFYYDETGKIMKMDSGVIGFPSSANLTLAYGGNGKLSRVTHENSSGNDPYDTYEYDGSGRLYRKTQVNSSGVVYSAMTYTYDSNGNVSRIDEEENGAPACYRLFTRDANNHVTREDFYPAAGGVVYAHVDYTRNDALRSITMELWLGTTHGFTHEITYDAGNFISHQETYDNNLASFMYTVDYTLQDGNFDPGGARGFYYTDTDVYGIVNLRSAPYSFVFDYNI